MPGGIEGCPPEFFVEIFLCETCEIDFKNDLIGVIERPLESGLERIGLL